jgi:hypothetical protein
MLEPTVFDFQEQPVRVLQKDGEPWFVTADVCRVLGIANPRNAAGSLDADEKGVHNVDTLGGRQEMSCVSESGLYALVFKSRKPQAKAFRKWVTNEVLPAIRREGKYVIDQGPEVLRPIRFLAIHEHPLSRSVLYDEMAAFARFLKGMANVVGLEHVRRPDIYLGSVRVFPEPFVEEQWEKWKECCPPKYQRRGARVNLSLPGKT